MISTADNFTAIFTTSPSFTLIPASTQGVFLSTPLGLSKNSEKTL